jgi:hypothetical protein
MNVNTDAPLTKVAVNNYLGVRNQEYVQRLYEISLLRPSDYTKTKIRLLGALKNTFNKQIFDTFYNLMLYGKDANNVQLINFSGVGALEPQLPLHQVEDFALSVVKTMNNMIDDCVELIMPKDYDNIVNRKMAQVGVLDNPQR